VQPQRGVVDHIEIISKRIARDAERLLRI